MVMDGFTLLIRRRYLGCRGRIRSEHMRKDQQNMGGSAFFFLFSFFLSSVLTCSRLMGGVGDDACLIM